MTILPGELPHSPRNDVVTPRRVLSARQATRLQRLTDAAVEELRAHGYEGLTVRAVAARCGVAAATAYTYFASKNHLVAELFWRRFRDLPEVELGQKSREDTVVEVMTAAVTLIDDDPAVATAYTVALLAQEPEVRNLRELIGAELIRRIETALGDLASRELVVSLLTHWSGAFLVTGMGYATAESVTDDLERGTRALLRSL
jgi:AcrR family transcriptional regulator